jgi:hypothetical protein
MKKWLIGVFAIIILFLVACQIFIPQNITVSRSVIAKANLNGAYRFLSDDSNWVKWWPEKFSAPGGSAVSVPESGEFQFIKTKTGYNSLEIVIKKDEKTTPSVLYLIPFSTDTIQIAWNTTMHASNNPFAKISQYLEARNLNRKMKYILGAMQDHISQVKNIYGVEIRKENIKLEFLVSRRIKIDHYPTNTDVYALMTEIRAHLQKNNVTEEALPIFNIEPSDSSDFLLLVAVPVSNPLPDTENFKTLKLLKNGQILVSEVHGGLASVDAALKKIKMYADDHKHLNVALPYRIFLNDQRSQPDSTKWVTSISYPCI